MSGPGGFDADFAARKGVSGTAAGRPHERGDAEELGVVRDQIDSIDAQLLELLNQRARCADTWAKIKTRYGEADVLPPRREAQVPPHPVAQSGAAAQRVSPSSSAGLSACLSLEPAGDRPLGHLLERGGSHFGHAARLAPQAAIDDVFREGRGQPLPSMAWCPSRELPPKGASARLDLLMGLRSSSAARWCCASHQHLINRETSLGAITRCIPAQSLASATVAQPVAARRAADLGGQQRRGRAAGRQRARHRGDHRRPPRAYDLPRLVGSIGTDPTAPPASWCSAATTPAPVAPTRPR